MPQPPRDPDDPTRIEPDELDQGDVDPSGTDPEGLDPEGIDPDGIDDVLGRVSETLDELDVVDGEERDALLGSLREVLGALGNLPGNLRPGTIEVRAVHLGVDPHRGVAGSDPDDAPDAPPARPSVRLMEGGRSDDAASAGDSEGGPALAARPDLRIQPDLPRGGGGREGTGGAGDPDGPDGVGELGTGPRGLKTGGAFGATPSAFEGALRDLAGARKVIVKRVPGPRSRAGGEGWSVVRLDGEPGREAWQTVFAGRAARTYRVQCSRGELRVYADGEPITELKSGQCCDVEAAVLRVSAEGVVRGRYLRITT